MIRVFALALIKEFIDEDYIVKYQGKDYLKQVLRAKDELLQEM